MVYRGHIHSVFLQQSIDTVGGTLLQAENNSVIKQIMISVRMRMLCNNGEEYNQWSNSDARRLINHNKQ